MDSFFEKANEHQPFKHLLLKIKLRTLQVLCER
jgi:hypothetical protein